MQVKRADHEAARSLGAPDEWRNAERFLPPGLWQDLLSRFEQEGHAEHCRYEAFLELLKPESLPDELVTLIMQLAEADPDPTMARSVVARLLHHKALSEDQLHRVAQSRLAAPHIVRQAVLLSRLRRRDPADVRLLEEAASEGGALVQQELLRLDALPAHVLQILAATGANASVRNAVRRRLND